jgi:hypothetical protein
MPDMGVTNAPACSTSQNRNCTATANAIVGSIFTLVLDLELIVNVVVECEAMLCCFGRIAEVYLLLLLDFVIISGLAVFSLL